MGPLKFVSQISGRLDYGDGLTDADADADASPCTSRRTSVPLLK
jgi:hypothetical protein